jgi:hypothetical protein
MTEPEVASSKPGRRSPSRGFPVVALGEAVDVVKTAGRYGRDHAREAFAGYMGHKTTNSGAFRQRLAAFRDWNLIEVGDGRIELTELGQRLAYPSSEDDEAKARRDAFQACEVFWELYDRSAKGTPLEIDNLANSAVHNHGVNPAKRATFGASFAASVVDAGLGEGAGEGKIRLDPIVDRSRNGHQADHADEVEDEDEDETKDETGGRNRKRKQSRRRAEFADDVPTIHQHWNVAGGELVFTATLDRAMPATAFGQVTKVIEAVEELVAVLGPEDGTDESATATS